MQGRRGCIFVFNSAIIVTLFAWIILAAPSSAQSLDAQRQALELITNTADRICNVVTARGEAQSSEVQGNVQAQLRGLASRLANAGISGTGSITSDQYQGVLREQLAGAIQDGARCKLEVFNTLHRTLLGNPGSNPSQSVPRGDRSPGTRILGNVQLGMTQAELRNAVPLGSFGLVGSTPQFKYVSSMRFGQGLQVRDIQIEASAYLQSNRVYAIEWKVKDFGQCFSNNWNLSTPGAAAIMNYFLESWGSPSDSAPIREETWPRPGFNSYLFQERKLLFSSGSEEAVVTFSSHWGVTQGSGPNYQACETVVLFRKT
jgi:hypothetical protein